MSGLFVQFGGHVDLIAGERFGDGVGRAQLFCLCGDFGFRAGERGVSRGHGLASESAESGSKGHNSNKRFDSVYGNIPSGLV